ncbi:MAG: thioredoxin [Bacteroidota bacterium]|nr:thioredoxin [Bacteroidota bacterium]
MALEITDANFEEYLASGKPMVVDFWAAWCGPCLQLAPTIEELAHDYEDKAVVGKLDVDNNPTTAGKYGIRSIPTILFFNNGELVDREVGLVPKRRLAEKLDKQLVGA